MNDCVLLRLHKISSLFNHAYCVVKIFYFALRTPCPNYIIIIIIVVVVRTTPHNIYFPAWCLF
jgi:hypothetical protein